LQPTVGTEYTVLAAAGATFSMQANERDGLALGNVKFLVSDPSGVVEPTFNTNGIERENLGTVATVSGVVGTVTITTTLSPKVTAGSRVVFSFPVASVSGTIALTGSPQVHTVKSVGGTTFSMDVTNAIAPFSTMAASASPAAVTVKEVRGARNTTNNTYVVNSGVNSAGTNETLELTVTGDTTRVVTVTAWKDANSNDIIDDNEYASPVRTVTFIKASEVVATAAFAPIVGDTALTAKISTVPVLNGQQVLRSNNDAVAGVFTRQGSAVTASNVAGTATWDDTAKTFAVSVPLSVASGTAIFRSPITGTTANASWSDLVKPAGESTANNLVLTTASGKITLAHAAGVAHNLNINDKVTFAGAETGFNVQYSIAAIPASNSFTVNSATASPTLTTASYTVTTRNITSTGNAFVEGVFAGTYTAQAYVGGAVSGAKVEIAPLAAVSDAVEIVTVGSASVQGKSFDSEDVNTTVIKTGTLELAATATVYDEDGMAVGANRPVAISFTGAGDTFKVNGKTGTHTVMTDANGAVALAVTALRGTVGATLTVKVSAEGGAATADIDFEWENVEISLIDLAKTGEAFSANVALTRTILKGGSYTFDFGVTDQWFTAAAAASYRVVVNGNGVTEGVRALTNGRASVTVTDNGLNNPMTTNINLQKLTGTTWANTSAHVLTTNIQTNPGVVLGAAGSSLYGSAVVLSSAVAKKALVELDTRTSTAEAPLYVNSALVNGKAINKSTNVGQSGAEVVVSGPSNILFFNGSVYKRGSITVLADANGLFQVQMYSTTAQTDTVVTVTSMGASATTKVTFTGIGVGEGTSLVITAPDFVAPASTLQVKAKLSDAFGNGVQAAAGRVKMTYTGAGIGFGTLPNSTDKNGELSYSVLLGAGDTGTITVVVSYDQNGDGDFVDAKDLNVTKTITVGSAPVVTPVADQKVNVGSFKGFVALYAKGYAGQKMSAIVAGKWIVVESLDSGFERVVRFTGAGFNITVKIYIDGKQVGSDFMVLTK
jgi:hypothetical protein